MDIEASHAQSLVLDLFPQISSDPTDYHSTAYAFECYEGNNYSIILDETSPILFYQFGRVNFIEALLHLSLLGVIEEKYLESFEPWLDQFFKFDSKNISLEFDKELMLSTAVKHLVKISRMNNLCACLYDEFYDKLSRQTTHDNYHFLQAVLSALGKQFIPEFILQQGVNSLVGMNTERHYLHFLHKNSSALQALESYNQALKLKAELDHSSFAHQFIIEKDKISFTDYERNNGKTFSSDWFNADPILNLAEESRITHLNEKN